MNLRPTWSSKSSRAVSERKKKRERRAEGDGEREERMKEEKEGFKKKANLCKCLVKSVCTF